MTDHERSSQPITVGECERVHANLEKLDETKLKAFKDSIDGISTDIRKNRYWLIGAALSMALSIFGGLWHLSLVGGLSTGDKLNTLETKVDTVCQKVTDLEKRADMNLQRVTKHDEFISTLQTFLKKDKGTPGAMGRFGKVEQKREGAVK